MLDLAVEYIKDLQQEVQVYQEISWKFTKPSKFFYLDLKPFLLCIWFLFLILVGWDGGLDTFR